MANAVEVKNLHKTFRLPTEKPGSLKQAVLNWHKQNYLGLQVLNDVSFSIQEGEFFGIIGRNGSGKSTLLKILAGIYRPSDGHVSVTGNLVPFIELGVGFNHELSGRDNVYLNGIILGLTHREIEKKYQQIVEFAELNKFMDQKLKNYSSGMQVRLAFSVAVQAQSDILLIDEVLAVGDLSFQRKCYDHFHGLKRQGKTVIFVTHDMNAVREFCDRGIVLHDGQIVAQGKPGAIVPKYQKLNLEEGAANRTDQTFPKAEEYHSEAKILSLTTKNTTAQKIDYFKAGEEIVIAVTFKALEDLPDPFVGVAITDIEGRVVFAGSTKQLNLDMGQVKKGNVKTAIFTIDNVYTDGTYIVSTAIDSTEQATSYARLDAGLRFTTGGRELSHSLVHPTYQITLNNSKEN